MKNVVKLHKEYKEIQSKLIKYGFRCYINIDSSDDDTNYDAVCWNSITENKNMFKFIKKYNNNNNNNNIISYLCKNENAHKLILKIYKQEYLYFISSNKNMIKFIKKEISINNIINKYNPAIRTKISENVNAYKILNKHKILIDWLKVSNNSGLIKLIKKEIIMSKIENRICNIDYDKLMQNNNAIDIIEEYMKTNKLSDYQLICLQNNSHPNILNMLEKISDKLKWISKYGNKSQICNNIDNLNDNLNTNKNIFEIDKLLYKEVFNKIFNKIE